MSEGNPGALWPSEAESTSATEALFEARKKIEELQDIKVRQGARILALIMENVALVDNADEELGGRYSRLSDGVHAIEHFTSCLAYSGLSAPSQVMQELLQDALEYGESGRLTELLSAALGAAEQEAPRDSLRSWET